MEMHSVDSTKSPENKKNQQQLLSPRSIDPKKF